jgi:hypothetical protein
VCREEEWEMLEVGGWVLLDHEYYKLVVSSCFVLRMGVAVLV